MSIVFKRDTKLKIRSRLSPSTVYEVPIYPDFSFSQTFKEQSLQKKTLHTPTAFFEDAVTTEANPASFSFTTPTYNIVHTFMRDMVSCDIIFETPETTYLLEMCVFEGCNYTMQLGLPILFGFSGTASKLSEVPTIPSTVVLSLDYSVHTNIVCSIGGSVFNTITSINMDLATDVTWLPCGTVQSHLPNSSITDGRINHTRFPTNYYIGNRTLSGSIYRYLDGSYSDSASSWGNGVPVLVKSLGPTGATNIEFALPSVVFTQGMTPADVFSQGYDFRLLNTQQPMSNIIKGDY